MKKKLGLMFLLLLALVVASYAQNADKTNYAVSELAVSAFQKLVINANIDVVLVQNDFRKAYVEGDEQLVPEIAVTVSNCNDHCCAQTNFLPGQSAGKCCCKRIDAAGN